MATALTAFLTNTADGLLTTANQLTNSAPGAEASTTTKVGSSTGWGELLSQGSAANWPALGSEPAASGNGWIWDVTTLEGKQLLIGNWTPTVKFANGSILTADIHCRAFRRSSGGVYTLIAESTLSGQVIAVASTVYSLPAVTGIQTDFNLGDKLYIDLILNITAGSALGSDTVTVFQNGGANEQEVTPGYNMNVMASRHSVTPLVAPEQLTGPPPAADWYGYGGWTFSAVGVHPQPPGPAGKVVRWPGVLARKKKSWVWFGVAGPLPSPLPFVTIAVQSDPLYGVNHSGRVVGKGGNDNSLSVVGTVPLIEPSPPRTVAQTYIQPFPDPGSTWSKVGVVPLKEPSPFYTAVQATIVPFPADGLAVYPAMPRYVPEPVVKPPPGCFAIETDPQPFPIPGIGWFYRSPPSLVPIPPPAGVAQQTQLPFPAEGVTWSKVGPVPNTIVQPPPLEQVVQQTPQPFPAVGSAWWYQASPPPAAVITSFWTPPPVYAAGVVSVPFPADGSAFSLRGVIPVPVVKFPPPQLAAESAPVPYPFPGSGWSYVSPVPIIRVPPFRLTVESPPVPFPFSGSSWSYVGSVPAIQTTPPVYAVQQVPQLFPWPGSTWSYAGSFTAAAPVLSIPWPPPVYAAQSVPSPFPAEGTTFGLHGPVPNTIVKTPLPVYATENAPPQYPQGITYSFANPFPTASSPQHRCAGTVVDDSTVGTVVWGNPSNAQGQPDGVAATAILNVGSHATHFLKATNYAYAVPDGVAILGFVVQVTAKASSAVPAIQDNHVRMVKGGTIQTTDRSNGQDFSVGSFGLLPYGSPTDAWGTFWTPADVNSSGFGVAFACNETGSGSGTASVDSICIDCYFATLVPPGHVTTAVMQSTSIPYPAEGSTYSRVGVVPVPIVKPGFVVQPVVQLTPIPFPAEGTAFSLRGVVPVPVVKHGIITVPRTQVTPVDFPQAGSGWNFISAVGQPKPPLVPAVLPKVQIATTEYLSPGGTFSFFGKITNIPIVYQPLVWWSPTLGKVEPPPLPPGSAFSAWNKIGVSIVLPQNVKTGTETIPQLSVLIPGGTFSLRGVIPVPVIKPPLGCFAVQTLPVDFPPPGIALARSQPVQPVVPGIPAVFGREVVPLPFPPPGSAFALRGVLPVPFAKFPPPVLATQVTPLPFPAEGSVWYLPPIRFIPNTIVKTPLPTQAFAIYPVPFPPPGNALSGSGVVPVPIVKPPPGQLVYQSVPSEFPQPGRTYSMRGVVPVPFAKRGFVTVAMYQEVPQPFPAEGTTYSKVGKVLVPIVKTPLPVLAFQVTPQLFPFEGLAFTYQSKVPAIPSGPPILVQLVDIYTPTDSVTGAAGTQTLTGTTNPTDSPTGGNVDAAPAGGKWGATDSLSGGV